MDLIANEKGALLSADKGGWLDERKTSYMRLTVICDKGSGNKGSDILTCHAGKCAEAMTVTEVTDKLKEVGTDVATKGYTLGVSSGGANSSYRTYQQWWWGRGTTDIVLASSTLHIAMKNSAGEKLYLDSVDVIITAGDSKSFKFLKLNENEEYFSTPYRVTPNDYTLWAVDLNNLVIRRLVELTQATLACRITIKVKTNSGFKSAAYIDIYFANYAEAKVTPAFDDNVYIGGGVTLDTAVVSRYYKVEWGGSSLYGPPKDDMTYLIYRDKVVGLTPMWGLQIYGGHKHFINDTNSSGGAEPAKIRLEEVEPPDGSDGTWSKKPSALRTLLNRTFTWEYHKTLNLEEVLK